MTGQVDGHDREPGGEMTHLSLPVPAITGPTVDEHHRWRATAVHLVPHRNAIGGRHLTDQPTRAVLDPENVRRRT